jgi:hypothetical protein
MTSAREFFDDNFQKFGGSVQDPANQNWNLYNGLCALAQDIEKIRHDTEDCKRLLLALAQDRTR